MEWREREHSLRVYILYSICYLIKSWGSSYWKSIEFFVFLLRTCRSDVAYILPFIWMVLFWFNVAIWSNGIHLVDVDGELNYAETDGVFLANSQFFNNNKRTARDLYCAPTLECGDPEIFFIFLFLFVTAIGEYSTQRTNNININYLICFFFCLYFVPDRSFLVANAQSEIFHIIFCSDGFCKMTGFTRAEVMQRSSTTEFLHGPMTSQLAVSLIRDALGKGVEKHFEILYYRKNGEYNLASYTFQTVGNSATACWCLAELCVYALLFDCGTLRENNKAMKQKKQNKKNKK